MKPRLQASIGQQLVLTPHFRQALPLLQLSAAEL
jgi:RNA polymerase sigma-54 factor